jgi:hypothetical protein
MNEVISYVISIFTLLFASVAGLVFLIVSFGASQTKDKTLQMDSLGIIGLSIQYLGIWFTFCFLVLQIYRTWKIILSVGLKNFPYSAHATRILDYTSDELMSILISLFMIGLGTYLRKQYPLDDD